MARVNAYGISAGLAVLAMAVVVIPLPGSVMSWSSGSQIGEATPVGPADLSSLSASLLFDISTVPEAQAIVKEPPPAPDILTSLSLIGVVRSDAKSVAILAKTGVTDPLFLTVGAKLGDFELREISPQYVTFWDKDQRRTLRLSTSPKAE